ncbi:copper resistance CopC family protein [Streptomyces sp. CAI-155]|uniref:copper resistance CopC family protein n=1 Tax=Streptomyces sp. CAI-155 TaxID=1472660 RepID=UPI0020CA507D|nr:copper resistance CopC family protein [Streptomyces sp. CAI-155]
MTITAPRLRLWALALVAGVGLLLGGSAPAAAHAVLEDTAPARGAVVAEPPAQVELVFSEAVSASGDGIRVLDPSGRRVDDGQPTAKGGGTYAVALSGPEARGTYTVTYQVESADSPPSRAPSPSPWASRRPPRSRRPCATRTPGGSAASTRRRGSVRTPA